MSLERDKPRKLQASEGRCEREPIRKVSLAFGGTPGGLLQLKKSLRRRVEFSSWK